MSRKTLLATFAALQSLLAGYAAPAAADTASTIPAYFFSKWTVSSNCTEAHAGTAAQVDIGLKFEVSRSSESEDGTYTLQAINTNGKQWLANWNGLKLQYRAGTKMTSIPADFECIDGEQSTSSLLAMSGYVQTAEPYYEQEHWYGLTTLAGQLEHVLIFPRAVTGTDSAIVVLESASSSSNVTLDEDGVLHSNN